MRFLIIAAMVVFVAVSASARQARQFSVARLRWINDNEKKFIFREYKR